jgi:hypothetical protein
MSNTPSPISTAVRRLFQTEEKTNNLGHDDIEEDIEKPRNTCHLGSLLGSHIGS